MTKTIIYRLSMIITSCILLSGCGGGPYVPFASEYAITVHGNMGRAIDMAIRHCNSHGKGMKLVETQTRTSGYVVTEIHTFMCTNDLD